MLARLILQLFKVNIKETFYYKFFYIFEIISIYMSLVIYHYTSLAFVGSVNIYLESYKTNYFSFIVLGEVLLSFPFFFLESPFRQVRNSIHLGVFETMLSLPISGLRSCFVLSQMGFLRVVFRQALTLIMAIVFFDLKVPISGILVLSVYQFAIIPFCIGIGLIVLAVFLITGRGNATLGYLSTMIAFFSGALFPVKVLPVWMTDNFLNIFPFSVFLEASRKIFSQGQNFNEALINISIFLIWGLVFFIGVFVLNIALEYRKKKGNVVISNY